MKLSLLLSAVALGVPHLLGGYEGRLEYAVRYDDVAWTVHRLVKNEASRTEYWLGTMQVQTLIDLPERLISISERAKYYETTPKSVKHGAEADAAFPPPAGGMPPDGKKKPREDAEPDVPLPEPVGTAEFQGMEAAIYKFKVKGQSVEMWTVHELGEADGQLLRHFYKLEHAAPQLNRILREMASTPVKVVLQKKRKLILELELLEAVPETVEDTAFVPPEDYEQRASRRMAPGGQGLGGGRGGPGGRPNGPPPGGGMGGR